MGFIYPGAFLMAGGGFAFSTNCCCKSYNCYCFRRSGNYGSQIIEQRIVRYRVAEWDNVAQKWVFPDGQPCVPAGAGCTVIFTGITVKQCSCSVGYGGSSSSWVPVDCDKPSFCPTILPPP